jgi:hypothetical protein
MSQVENHRWTMLFEHIKQVARDDVRLYFAPFVWIFKEIKDAINRIRYLIEKIR